MSEQVEEVKPEVRKITQKIVGYRVKTEETIGTPTDTPILKEPIVLTKPTKLERSDVLHGSTYKIKQPQLPEAYKHGFYMTINNISVNGKLVPYELLIDTKNSECWPMLSVLTLTLTTLFRHQLDISHLLEEYHTVQDGKGGYRGKLKSWQEKPKYYNSILGEFADVIEHHLSNLAKINQTSLLLELTDKVVIGHKAFIPEMQEPNEDVPNFTSPTIQSIGICPECKEDTMVLRDGCPTCTDCGHSKCG